MDTIFYIWSIILGIIFTTFPNKIISLDEDKEKKLGGVQYIPKPPKIVLEVICFMGGFVFLTIGITKLANLSILSTTITMLGYLFLRFSKYSGRKLSEFMKNQLHSSVPTKAFQVCCLIIGIIVIVIGMFNFI